MGTTTKAALTLVFLSLACAQPCAAIDGHGCEYLVNGCLSRSLSRRDECFNSIATSPSCIGTPMGDLVSKRAHLTPSLPWGEPEGPGFLGPREFDRTCIDSFDLQLGSALAAGTLDEEGRATLRSHLNQCIETPPAEIARP